MSSDTRYGASPSLRTAAAASGGLLAGVLLVVSSCMNVLQGLSALARDDVYATESDYLYALDLTSWGTIHLVLGVLGLVVGIGILVHASWALVAGMVVAGITIVTNFAFMPYFPVWAVIVIAFNVFVIWALTVQLRD